MLDQIVNIFIYASFIAGISFFLIGKPSWNYILLLFAIPFEDKLNIIPQLSLIKSMSVLTFLSLTFHRKDFIPFVYEKFIMNHNFLIFLGLFAVSSILALEKALVIGEFMDLAQVFLIIVFTWYLYDRSPQSIRQIEISYILFGLVLLWIIFSVQGIATQTQRLSLARLVSPNTLAPFFIGLAVIAYNLWSKKHSKVMVILILIFIGSVILTGNRSIPLGFFIFLLFYLTSVYRLNRVKFIVPTAIFLIVLMVIPLKRDSFIFNTRTRITYTFKQIYELVFHGRTRISSYEQAYHTDIYRSSRIDQDLRLMFYQVAFDVVKKRPLFGAGPGSRVFERSFTRLYGFYRSVHSNLGEIAVFYGFIGLFLFFALIFKLIRYGYNRLTYMEGKLFLAIVIMFFIDGLFHRNYKDAVIIAFATMMGFKLLTL